MRHAFLSVLVVVSPVWAADVSLGVSTSAALPMSSPQTAYFGVGPAGSITGSLQVHELLDVELQGVALSLGPSAASPTGQRGTAMGVLGGLRVKRPLGSAVILPWLAARVGIMSSGVSSLMLAPAVGVHFRASESSAWLFGPMAQFSALFKLAEAPNADTVNAMVLSFGLAVEFAPRGERDDAPLVSSVLDSDGDGVPDETDRCARSAEDADGFQDEDGCPDPDNDEDGVADAKDACANQRGSATASGCPDEDGDGVADAKDACPRKPGKARDEGCPTYKEVVVTATKLEIKQKLYFAFGTTTILPKSYPLLAEVTQALEDHATLCVRVEGHTDAVGSPERNLRLSAGRAEAVRDYLAEQGLPRARLSSKGYGSSLPMESNATPDGRENNRRVEFVIVPCGEVSAPQARR